MNAVFAARLGTVGLRPHTFFVLVHLTREPALTSAELARRLEMTPPSSASRRRGRDTARLLERVLQAVSGPDRPPG
jgi:hypothetical protein